MKYAILIFISCAIFSCSKKEDDIITTSTASGYWIGSTNTYGIGTIIRSNGTARQLFNTSSLTLNDTSSSNVFKEEGTYVIVADSIFINSATVQLKGKMNTDFTSMQGASRISSGGLIVNQTFTMVK